MGKVLILYYSKDGSTKKMAGFVAEGAKLTCQTIMTILMNFGFLVFGVTDYSGHQFTTHYGATQAGEPREQKEIESCMKLGRRLSEWVAVFVDGRKDLHPLKGLYKRNPWD